MAAWFDWSEEAANWFWLIKDSSNWTRSCNAVTCSRDPVLQRTVSTDLEFATSFDGGELTFVYRHPC